MSRAQLSRIASNTSDRQMLEHSTSFTTGTGSCLGSQSSPRLWFTHNEKRIRRRPGSVLERSGSYTAGRPVKRTYHGEGGQKEVSPLEVSPRPLGARIGTVPDGPMNTPELLHHPAKGEPKSRVQKPVDVSVRRAVGNPIGLCVNEDMVVTTVVKGSAAEKAGLKRGQILTSVDGASVRSQDEAISAMQRAGNDVSLTVGAPTAKERIRKLGSAGPIDPRRPCTQPDPHPDPVGIRHIGPPGLGPTGPHTTASPPRLRPTPFEPEWRSTLGKTLGYGPGLSPSRKSRALEHYGHRWNKTSYEKAMDNGDIEGEHKLWTPETLKRGMKYLPHPQQQRDAPVTHHFTPENQLERAQTYANHSPRLGGRARSTTPSAQYRSTSARGHVPGTDSPSAAVRGRRPHGHHGYSDEFLHHDHTVKNVSHSNPRFNPRSRTPQPGEVVCGRGDLISHRNRRDPPGPDSEKHHGGHEVPISVCGTHLSPKRKRPTADFEHPVMRRRSFTPTARHQRPVPSSTDIFHRGQAVTESCQDLTNWASSGRRVRGAQGHSWEPHSQRTSVQHCLA